MNLPSPDSPLAPKYWMHETGGELAPAVGRYIRNESLSGHDVYLIAAYLRQWIGSPVWLMNPDITDEGRKSILDLRINSRLITTRKQIDEWIAKAADMRIDPL